MTTGRSVDWLRSFEVLSIRPIAVPERSRLPANLVDVVIPGVGYEPIW
jgi:hypothetical protein